MGLLNSHAFNKDLKYYPSDFQKFGLMQIRQVVDSGGYVHEVLELKRTDKLKDLRGYDRFLEASVTRLRNRPSMLKPDEWGQELHVVHIQ